VRWNPAIGFLAEDLRPKGGITNRDTSEAEGRPSQEPSQVGIQDATCEQHETHHSECDGVFHLYETILSSGRVEWKFEKQLPRW